MILYPAFYKRHGLLRFDQLSAPRLGALNLFELPRQSLLQYWPMNDFDYGPDMNEFWVTKADGQIFIDHVVQMTSQQGNPRSSQQYPKPLVLAYRKTHRRFRPLQNLDTATRDDKTIVVRNYGIIPHLWRYRVTMLTGYQQWYNLRDTFWKGVEQWGQESDRQQYVFFQLPARLPTKAEFQKAHTAITRESLKAFNTWDALNLLDLWQWVGDDRERSLMRVLSESTLERLNLVFIESGKFSVVNLGLLNKWRKVSKEELSELSEEEKADILKTNTQSKGGGIIQLRLFVYVNNLLKLRSVAAATGIVEAPDPETGNLDTVAVVNADNPEADVPVGDTVKVTGKSKDAVVGKPAVVKTTGPVVGELKDAPLSNPLTDPVLIADTADVSTVYLESEEDADGEIPDLVVDAPDDLDDLVDASDDDTLPAISAAAWAKLGVVPNPATLPPTNNFDDYANGVMSKANEMANLGLITGPQYKAFERNARAFERIPNPIGTGTLKDMATIHPAMIQDIKVTEMPDADTILDKSMLQSTIVDYDERYITTLLPRNIAQMALQIQSMGIAVTDYKVERVQDIMGATDQYAMKVVPVSGAPSTVKFSLPVVQPNGVYTAGGVKYRLRRQRGDMPIRKVSSNRVALTSYYGKLFVIRGERVVQNYGKWLRAQLQAAVLASDTTFSDLSYGKYLYTEKRLPRAYTAISEQFGGFSYGVRPEQSIEDVNRIQFHWAYKQRAQYFGDTVLTDYEGDGLVVVGVVDGNAANGVITMDMLNELYLNRPGKTLVSLGTVEDLFGLDTEKAPVEYCEIKVFGKPVQVGFVLAYYYGLGKLCRMLNVDPRRVPRGGQLHLQKDEWVLRFADETLVFDRSNPLATQVLAGLKVYQRFLSNYSVLGFDNPEIYGAILSATGLGNKYLRELDIMRQMFVDHITKDLLIMQNEPTTLPGLLMRSCEMLLTDDSPDETDHLYQIEKGYERFAGAVYSELVKGVRSYYSNPTTSRASIAIPHTAVFQAIQNDSAQQLVEDSNPIHNLKEKEAVTFNGTGGRSGRTMAKRSRVFHPNDRGIISEATVDNSDVAVNTYLAANPKLTSLYGTVGKFDEATDGVARQLSTSALVSPCATNDDQD